MNANSPNSSGYLEDLLESLRKYFPALEKEDLLFYNSKIEIITGIHSKQPVSKNFLFMLCGLSHSTFKILLGNFGGS